MENIPAGWHCSHSDTMKEVYRSGDKLVTLPQEPTEMASMPTHQHSYDCHCPAAQKVLTTSKKRSRRQKNMKVLSHEVEGYQGDKDLDDLLRYIEGDTTGTRTHKQGSKDAAYPSTKSKGEDSRKSIKKH